MPISIYVPALTFNVVTGISIHLVTPVVCIVCTLYTCVGGIKGVVWTDVLQSLIMIGTLVIVAMKGTFDVGGLGVIYERNLNSGRLDPPDFTLDPTVRMGFFAVFIGGTIFKLQGICISQPAAQRFFSLPDMKAVKQALINFIIGLASMLALCVYVALLAYAEYYDCDPLTTGLAKAKDQIVPLYVMQTAGMYPGMTGLFVSGVFSAALSSLSTALNAMSAVILKDFIEPYRSVPLTERQTAIVLRSMVLIFGFSSLALVHVVEHLGLVMQLSSTFNSMTTGPVLGIFVVGVLMPFINTKSVFTGCLTSATIMGYIAVRAQFEIATGKLKFPTKPVSVESCDYEFTLPATWNITSIGSSIASPPTKELHHISFLCYTLFGALITICVSLLATLYFGRQDTSELDPMLIAPFMRRFLKPRPYNALSQANNVEGLQTAVEEEIELRKKEDNGIHK